MKLPKDSPAAVVAKESSASVVELYPPMVDAANSPAPKAAEPLAVTPTVDLEGKGDAKEKCATSKPARKKTKAPQSASEAPPRVEVQTAKHACAFGWVELNGTKYDFDVIVHVDGTVTQRDKSLSRKKKQKYGHTPLTGKELLLLKSESPEMIIIGTGHSNAMPLTPKAEKMLDEHEFFVGSTPRALIELTASTKKTVALLHVTC